MFPESYIHALVKLQRYYEAKQVIKKFIGKERTRRTGHWMRVLRAIYTHIAEEDKLKKLDTRLDKLRDEYNKITKF